MNRTLHLIVPLAALSACASDSEFRRLSTSTGTVVQTLRTGTDQFVESQNALNADTAARLDRLASAGDERALRARRQHLAWTGADAKDRISLFEAATEESAEDIVAKLQAPARRPPISDGGAGDAYDKAQESLKTLSAKPSRMSVLAGLLSFGRAIQEAYDKKKEELEADGENSVAEAATVTASDIPSP